MISWSWQLEEESRSFRAGGLKKRSGLQAGGLKKRAGLQAGSLKKRAELQAGGLKKIAGASGMVACFEEGRVEDRKITRASHPRTSHPKT